MKRLFMLLFVIFLLSSCAHTEISTRKHSYDTKAGKKKLAEYNARQFGGDRVFKFRVQKTKKANKKAGYKAPKHHNWKQ